MDLKLTLKKNLSPIMTYGFVTVAFIIMQSLSSAGMLTRSVSGYLVPICVYIVLAVSLNLVVGISGELSLGHAGFMGVGAFAGVVAAACLQNMVDNDLLRLVIAMAVGGIFAGFAGVIIGIPVLRLRGDYLAIVTLARVSGCWWHCPGAQIQTARSWKTGPPKTRSSPPGTSGCWPIPSPAKPKAARRLVLPVKISTLQICCK